MKNDSSRSLGPIVIIGPTASGKSSAALELYQALGGGGIVNADAFQVYRQLSVGVAKPTDDELLSIPHFLFGELDCLPKTFNASSYRDLVDKLLPVLGYWVDGPPIFVGGSLFYVKALFFRLAAVEVGVSDSGVARPEGLSDWEYLRLIDPDRAGRIHVHDDYRVQRALEIYQSTGRRPSEYEPVFDPIGDSVIVVWVDVSDEVLRARIVARVDEMFSRGWVAEVEGLIGTPFEEFVKLGYVLGYDDVYQWIVTGKPLELLSGLKKTIIAKTWDYVRRQRKFWRSFKRSLLEKPGVFVFECSPADVVDVVKKNYPQLKSGA